MANRSAWALCLAGALLCCFALAAVAEPLVQDVAEQPQQPTVEVSDEALEYLRHIDDFKTLLGNSLKAHQAQGAERVESDPYEVPFTAFETLWKIRDVVLKVADLFKAPFSFLSSKFRNLLARLRDSRKTALSMTEPELLMFVYENCGLVHQPNVLAGNKKWETLELQDARLATALKVDRLGVLARSCVEEDVQKKFLFAEYKFVLDKDGRYTGEVEPNDDVPLMAEAGRRGSLAFANARMRFPLLKLKYLYAPMMHETREAIRALFPWAASYIEDECDWVFNTAGNGIAQICYIYGSMTENIVFWGSPIGNRGFSGSYDSKVWDHMLTGTMKTFEAGHLSSFVQRPGQFHLLDRWSGNYYTIDEDCYMLDYVQGNVAQSMKFAIIVPTRYYTLDYRSTMKTICQYASLVLKNGARQGTFGFDLLYSFWRRIIKKDPSREQVTTADCVLNEGLPAIHPKFRVGDEISPDEVSQFKLDRTSERLISEGFSKQLVDPDDV